MRTIRRTLSGCSCRHQRNQKIESDNIIGIVVMGRYFGAGRHFEIKLYAHLNAESNEGERTRDEAYSYIIRRQPLLLDILFNKHLSLI